MIRTILEDPDDPENLILDLGLDLCKQLGWEPGDVINWIDNKDGTWTLEKQPTQQK
jgi:DNA-binding Xre family transcriptional regulator